MLKYKIIEIFTGEEVKCQGRPLASAIVTFVNSLKVPARTIVTRGIEGSYESGEVATGRLELLTYNMPLRITVILPAAECDPVLSHLTEMIADGIVTVRDADVVTHKTRGRLLPRHMRVRDIMTPDPKKVGPETPLDEVVRCLLPATFTGLPVVDGKNRPVGVIAQGDLIYKADMPMRLGLLAQSDQKKMATILESLATKRASDIMTRPAVLVDQDRPITEAVGIMLQKGVKRLPVVDGSGILVGMLSRLDIFQTIIRECPDWRGFEGQRILVEDLRTVADIMRRDVITVGPDAPIENVIQIIACNDVQRVSVIDPEGRFLGLISDRDLLIAFSDRHPGIWDYFASKIPFTDSSRRNRELVEHLRAKTAADVMNADVVTVREDTPIEEAIQIMLKRAFKRLPVLDTEGKFKGMINRDSLLRTGFTSS